MKIIGVSAKAGHGKDFTAKLLLKMAEQDYGKKAVIWSFAHLLKARVYGEARGDLSFEDIWIDKPAAVRTRLQRAGTEEGREVFGEDFWMLQTEAILRCFADSGVELVIIPDVRFLNEVVFCHLGGRAMSRFDEQCWEQARKVYNYTPDLEQTYIDNNDVEGLWEIEQDVSGLQSMLFVAEMGTGRVIRIKSDRPTLSGAAALHPSETSLDDVSEDVFDFILENNVETTVEQLTAQLTPILDEYLGED